MSLLREVGLTFAGSRVIEVSPEASTGLEKIYVVENLDGATATYPAAPAQWSLWSSGAAYAEPVTATTDGSSTSYTFSEADGSGCGVTVETGGRMYHFWVVDYSAHHVEFTDVTVSDFNNDCTTMYLDVAPLQSGANYSIPYYTINGAPRVLDRGYTLCYNTLEYDENNKVYNQVVKDTDLESLKQLIRVDKPLCDTRFTLSGDRFAREWGFATTVESDNYTTDAVEAMTYAEKEERDNDNEQNDQTTGLGGSAPVTITFVAAVTDAAKFTEWQLSSSPEFSNYEPALQPDGGGIHLHRIRHMVHALPGEQRRWLVRLFQPRLRDTDRREPSRVPQRVLTRSLQRGSTMSGR